MGAPLRAVFRHPQAGVPNVRKLVDAAAPRRDCARVASAQTREFAVVVEMVIICAVLAALATLATPDTLRKVGRFAAGAQIITGDSSSHGCSNKYGPQ